MKFKKFMKAIYAIHAELPSDTKLPSKEWFKTNIPKEDRELYLAAAIEDLALFKFAEKLDNTIKSDEEFESMSSIDEDDENTNEDVDEIEPTNIDKVLIERRSNYGQFADFANLAQNLKSTFDNTVIAKGQPELFTDAMNEAIEMCFHKLARIGTGNPLYLDSARDLVGYAQLLVNEIETQEGVTDAKVTKLVRENGEWIPQ